jgi:hypothetical protein
MKEIPGFPYFKPVKLDDREIIIDVLRGYQPQISELTFTNFFIWRKKYRFRWSLYKHDTVIVLAGKENVCCAFQPFGFHSIEASTVILDYLKTGKKIEHPRIVRADHKTARALSGNKSLVIEPQREHFDYLYNTQDLINLSGRKYHSKRNHITRFESMYGSYKYSPLTFSHINDCLELSDRWCTVHHCDLSLDLCEEWMAIREALFNFDKLKLSGGVILIDNRVEAFSFGEQLNSDTVVVHMEKASTEFHGLYAMINKMTTEREWNDSLFVNREQDLGDQGLRQAKESYLPVRMVEKYKITG